MLTATATNEIWYMKPEFFSYGILGFNLLKNKGLLPSVENLSKTHIKVGNTELNSPEEIFIAMQGEIWSPHGEQNQFLYKKGLAHTSMSVGDICIIDGKTFICDNVGFKELE